MTIDPAPYIDQGRTMLPIRAILEPLGASFAWDAKTRTVTVYKGSKKVQLVINNKNTTINGVKYVLDVPAQIIEGRTFVPLRFIAENFDAYVEWDGTARSVKIFQNGYPVKKNITVSGYYFNAKSLDDLKNYLGTISDTIHFSYELNTSARVEEKVYFNQGHELAKENNKKVEMLVFANDREQLKKIMNDVSLQKKIIDDIYDFLVLRNYDGVNIDFEFIDKTQSTQFVKFISDLKNKLGSKYNISLSLPPRTSTWETWYDGYDYKTLANLVDRIMIMAYDQHYFGGEPGPVAGADWVEKVIKYMQPLIPKEKFILGLGIYGYDWPSEGTGKAVLVQTAINLADSKNLKIKRDEIARVPYFSYLDDTGIQHQVWFEDALSVQTKLELVKKYDLTGIALWRLGIIPKDIWQVIQEF